MFHWALFPSCFLLFLTSTSTSATRPPPDATVASTTSAATNQNTRAGSADTVVELYMHDISGATIHNNQVQFASPIGSIPVKNIMPLPTSNGAIPTINGNTGLSGTAVVQTPSGLVSTGQIQTQLGPDELGHGFGTIIIIDDVLTSRPDHGARPIGKAQGVYVSSSSDGSTQMMAFTVTMDGEEYGDSFNLFGVCKVGSTAMSRLSIVGGTGKYTAARGYAEVRPLVPEGQNVTDGSETILRITAHISY